MKILHCNTSLGGGAGIAARRQVEALRTVGHDARLLYLVNDWKRQDIAVEHDGWQIRLRVPGSPASFNSALASAYAHGNRSELSDTWMSLWATELPFDEAFVEVAAEFDVVHLHWVAHLVSSTSLARLAERGVRLVFTGHDMNPFTGFCHYTAGCERHRTGCAGCAQLRRDPLELAAASFQAKLQAVSGLAASWVFPSRWLADEFDRSTIGEACGKAHVIRNCLDIHQWRPAAAPERGELRTAHGFGDGDLVLVAGAHNNKERRKGFDLMVQALAAAERQLPALTGGRRVVIVTFGHEEPAVSSSSPWLEHVYLGPQDETGLMALFRAADLLLFPSREENFANTILEALLCGCPVAAFGIGGVPEAVEDGVNGVLVPAVDGPGFAAAVTALLRPGRLAELRTSTLRWAEGHARRFAPETIADELETLYRLPAAAASEPLAAPPPRLWASLCAEAGAIATRSAFLMQQLRSLVHQPARQALYSGFYAPEINAQWGQVQWLAREATVHFRAPPGSRCTLVMQVPVAAFPMSLLESAADSLQARLDGRPAEVQAVRPGPDGQHAYLIVGATATDDGAAIHTLELRFASLGVSPERDPRMLSLLVSQAGLLSTAAGHEQDERNWDIACCATSLLASGPSSSTAPLADDRPPAPPDQARTWIDLLQA